jgi:hypothetical protein
MNSIGGFFRGHAQMLMIKRVNSNALTTGLDMGLDGDASSQNNKNFARDAFGYTLTYNANDYAVITWKIFANNDPIVENILRNRCFSTFYRKIRCNYSSQFKIYWKIFAQNSVFIENIRQLLDLITSSMEKNLPIHLQEIIFSSSDKKLSKQISKLEKEGKLRKIAPRIYSSNLTEEKGILTKESFHRP